MSAGGSTVRLPSFALCLSDLACFMQNPRGHATSTVEDIEDMLMSIASRSQVTPHETATSAVDAGVAQSIQSRFRILQVVEIYLTSHGPSWPYSATFRTTASSTEVTILLQGFMAPICTHLSHIAIAQRFPCCLVSANTNRCHRTNWVEKLVPRREQSNDSFSAGLDHPGHLRLNFAACGAQHCLCDIWVKIASAT